MQFTCVPGNDGGIKQSFFVEVIISKAKSFKVVSATVVLAILQVFDGSEKVFNVSSEQPTFLLRKLPSDTRLVVRVRNIFVLLLHS